MKFWLKNFLTMIIALLAVFCLITGDKGGLGQQSIARGWDLSSGEITVALGGYPLSDFIWFFIYQISGWVGVLGLLGALGILCVIMARYYEDKAGLPFGSLMLLIFIFGNLFLPGPLPFLVLFIFLHQLVLKTNNLKSICFYQVLWIFCAPFSWISCAYLICARLNANRKLFISLFFIGLIFDFFRISSLIEFSQYFICFSSKLSFALFLIFLLIFIFVYKKNRNLFFDYFISMYSGILSVFIIFCFFGYCLFNSRIYGLFPQEEQLRAFSEVFRARNDLISIPIYTDSKWVLDGCRITAGLRHCLNASGTKERLDAKGVFLIGDPDPRRSASMLVAECARNPNLAPQVFSGSLCLLAQSGQNARRSNFQGSGVRRSAEAVMAFAWFESAQNRPNKVKDDNFSGLSVALKWAEMAMRANPNDGLAWGITGELILAKHFLNPETHSLSPMEQEAWLCQAAFCFRRALDLDPFDKKTSRVFAELLREAGAFDLAETILDSGRSDLINQDDPDESFFLDKGPARVMDLKHLLEYRFPGEADRSLERIRNALALGLKGQALVELDRGGAERFGLEGARIRLKLLLETGFADSAMEMANLYVKQGMDLGLSEWRRPGGVGLGATWKLPTIPWVQGVSNLAMNPFGGNAGCFDELKNILKMDQNKVGGRITKDLPLIVAKNVLVLPGNPLALRIECAMEYSNRESLFQLGMAIAEELRILDRLESELGGL